MINVFSVVWLGIGRSNVPTITHGVQRNICFLIWFVLNINLTFVPKHKWWIDSGATTHIIVSMQGCLSCRKPIDGERYIYMGYGKSVEVEAIGTFRLLLRTHFYLELNKTFIVPLFRQNLISIYALDKFGFSCSFRNSKFSLF